jgi:hypothetical protein
MRTVNLIALAIAIALALFASRVTAQLAAPPAPAPRPPVHKSGLLDWLFGGPKDRGEPAPPPMPAPVPRPAPREEEGQRARPIGEGTYRTLCVRLCDGFYFPISFATGRGKLKDDASRCERQCPARSRLFVYRNPGQTLEEMVDLDGKPYTKLETAFRFQAEYVADCTCHGNPWDPEALARHQSYPPTDAAAIAKAEPPPDRRNRYSSYRNRKHRDDED